MVKEFFVEMENEAGNVGLVVNETCTETSIRSSIVSHGTKLCPYKTIVGPFIAYKCETWPFCSCYYCFSLLAHFPSFPSDPVFI